MSRGTPSHCAFLIDLVQQCYEIPTKSEWLLVEDTLERLLVQIRNLEGEFGFPYVFLRGGERGLGYNVLVDPRHISRSDSS